MNKTYDMGHKPVSLAHKKLGFNIHAVSFVAVMAGLVGLNLWLGAPYWVAWVFLGWAVGLFCHWFFVLGPGAPAADAG
jgi:hypothetical protein